MSDTPPESAAQLAAEQAWLAGAIATGAGYGVVIALCLLCLRALLHRLKHESAGRGRNVFFFVYVCIMFVFGSLFFWSNTKFTQLAFIDHRGFPGGPSAYEEQEFSIGTDEISNVSYVLSNWLADSLLVWRCVIIYRDFGMVSGYTVLAVAGLMQLASYVLGSFFLVQISSPSSSPYTYAGQQINWTLPYLCVSLAINIVVTILVVVRLLLYRRAMIQLLGPGHAAECTSVVAMLIESAAVYATFSLLFLVPYVVSSTISHTFLQVLGEAQLMAPLLIIYREAQGKGWITSASSVASSMANGDRSIRIARFTDIQFASDMSYSQETGEVRSKELTSKQFSSLGHMTMETIAEEERREEIELGEL